MALSIENIINRNQLVAGETLVDWIVPIGESSRYIGDEIVKYGGLKDARFAVFLTRGQINSVISGTKDAIVRSCIPYDKENNLDYGDRNMTDDIFPDGTVGYFGLNKILSNLESKFGGKS